MAGERQNDDGERPEGEAPPEGGARTPSLGDRIRRGLFSRTALMIRVALIVPLTIFMARHFMEKNKNHGVVEYGLAPRFELHNQLGEPVRTEDLRGQPWIANFIFTRCPSVCPLLTAKFKNFQGRTEDLEGVRYVSFSVDPEHDTPEVLAEYAAKFDADPDRWWFLTGSIDALKDTVVQGFKIHMGDRVPMEDDPTIYDIAHGEYFVLVDKHGEIVGYYDSKAQGLLELEEALREIAE